MASLSGTPPPILDITTERERLTVRIDGTPYELRDTNDLSLSNIRFLERVGARLFHLESLPELSKDQDAEYSTILGQVCALGIDAPAAVIDKLGTGNRLAIARTFFELSTPGLQRMRASAPQTAAATPSPSPGAKSSRGSNGSTAGIRSRGSRPSRRGR